MIIDIAVIVIILIGLGVGFLRNPIKCAIDFVLFIAFTFIFYNILVGMDGQILSMFGISFADIGKMEIGKNLYELNNSLTEFSKSLNININGVDPILMNDDIYVEAGKALVHAVFFIISSVVSILLAYVIGWGIYAIFRNKVQNIKKIPKMISSVAISFVCVLTFVAFTFSPIYMISNNAYEVSGYVENENTTNLITFLNDTDSKFQDYNKTLDDALYVLSSVQSDVDVYQGKVIQFDNQSEDIIRRYLDIKNRAVDLSKKTLEPIEQAAVEEIIEKAAQYEVDVENAKNYVENIKKDFVDLKNSIDSYVKHADSAKSTIEDLHNTAPKVDEYYSQAVRGVKTYQVYIPKMFSFLGNLNFGYANMSKTAANISNLNDFFNLVMNNLDTLVNDDSVKFVNALKIEADKVTDLIDDYEKELKDVKDIYNSYKADIDNRILDGENQINTIDSELSKYEEMISELERKYN